MVYKKFRFLVVIRILLIIVFVFLFYYLMKDTRNIVSGFIVAIFIIFQTYSLIRFVERTNRKLTQFLESIRHSDFSSSFSDKGRGKSFEDLSHAFNEVIEEFKATRTEKEEHYNYLQTVVQHVSIGIIAFKKDGKVDMFNNAIKRLLRINNLRYISDLSKIKEDFPEILMNLRAGSKSLVKVIIQDEFLQLSIYATEFRMREEEYTLVSVQNIHTELEEKEIESWQKLIRVLTHEIMNSITPISSLASTVKDILIEEGNGNSRIHELDESDIESVNNALVTIQKRSQGLLNFVEIYRNLTRIPKPSFKHFPVMELIQRVNQLLKPKFEEQGVNMTAKVLPEDLMLTADPDLIDQVIINLILNSIDAIKEKDDPKINVFAISSSNNRVLIEISDNGYGIKPDILDKIFMPFFTSKKHGSGIGLSLSRQIMHLHKGSINVKSKPGEGTTFTLVF
jgi:two-component system nitrogen regulation sensor histidine kinase NtrY